MTRIRYIFFFTIISLFFSSVWADDEMRYRQLTQELRCLVCQNQNLADSDAPLASDLRRMIRERLHQGDSDQAIVDFLTARYGEFILFKPSVTKKNIFLWVGPLFILFFSMAILIFNMRKRKKDLIQQAPLSFEEKAHLERLLK